MSFVSEYFHVEGCAKIPHMVEDDALRGIFHETAKENKGKEFAFGGFGSLLCVDTKHVEVSPLHMIFDLNGVIVGKEYFRINHLLLSSFNLA
jgi:hypothetical protein